MVLSICAANERQDLIIIRLGIEPNRERAGYPQDNGAHERMHKDMKKELQAGRADLNQK